MKRMNNAEWNEAINYLNNGEFGDWVEFDGKYAEVTTEGRFHCYFEGGTEIYLMNSLGEAMLFLNSAI